MYIILAMSGDVKVDDYINMRDVQTSVNNNKRANGLVYVKNLKVSR
jgi:hypothetical protein